MQRAPSRGSIYANGTVLAKSQKKILVNRPLVLIEWVDASRLTAGDWMDLNEVQPPDPHRCLSVGFIASENSKGIVLVPTIADVDHTEHSHVYGGIMIPAGSIVLRETLR
jgi:hypothetical protein